MTDSKNEKKKQHMLVRLIPGILFLVFIFFMMFCSLPGKVKSAITNTNFSFQGLEALSNTFEETLQENLFGGNGYINLNGLVTRVLGINSLNERYKLANGYLAREEDAKDTAVLSENVIELNEFLAERGIDFLYLQAPSKETFYDAEFAPGYSCDGWKTIDSMVKSLTQAGVNTLDMNAWFEENCWQMEDVFFKTDHHWLPQAGLAAARCTMELLEENGLVTYDEDLLSEENYDIQVYENWFLGSAGKRVGIGYAGVDDISVYFPKFETNYTYAGLSANTTNWTYSDSPLNLKYLEKRDYFNSNPYCIYLYGNNPIQVVTNTKAENDKRVLVFGDSFRMTWEYFLTSQFQEIYFIDLRYYTDGTLAEFIEEIQPDIAMMCIEPAYMKESSFEFGVEEYVSTLNETKENEADVSTQSDVLIEAKEDDDDKFVILFDNLEPNQTYTLTVDSTKYFGGEDLYVQMTLQDLSTNEAICNRYFDANCEETQKWIFTVPDNSDTYAVYVYSGTKGHTENVSAEVKNVKLRKGIFEE